MRFGTLALAVVLVACKRSDKEAPVVAATGSAALVEAADEAAAPTPAKQKKGAARGAGEKVPVPAGTFVAGSVPGDRGRDPTLEARQLEVKLEEFAVDALPHPNDPSRPPTTGLSRSQAAEACSKQGGRLCSELEWERACKGPEGHEYAGAAAWDPECAKHPEICASGFGVLAMGGALREWTASDVDALKGFRASPVAAVRGASGEVADVDHRCARRTAVDASTTAVDLGFRCCYGSPTAATIPAPEWPPTIQKVEFSADRLAGLFASNPRLKAYAEGIKYFREEASVTTVLQRGKACPGSAPPSNAEILTTSPVVWSPVPGEEILLVTGQSAQNRSFIVAFHRLVGDRYRVAAAMLMEDEPGPVALVYNQNVRKKLEWATALQCPGESGNISYRDENRVAITQR
ncbi:MAG: hypothetical protein FJ096_00290 [Deltaproteobacteria bacterium]|nr:hypothetical protein [Deltaproteobacteria bacterium]